MARVKRPRPEREGPLRSWSTALGADGPEGGPAKSPGSDATSGNGQDPLRRGIVTGGRVVDEWIRQAEQTARLLGQSPTGSAWPDASSRMFKAASDLMAAWLAAVSMPLQTGAAGWNGATAPSRSQPMGTPGAAVSASVPEADPGAEDPVGRRDSGRAVEQRMRLDVTSPRPVEVSIVLHARGVTRFRVLDLRPERGDAPRIHGPQLEPWDADGLTLRLEVPADQPPGLYHAVILDEVADCAAGTLTVRVRE